MAGSEGLYEAPQRQIQSGEFGSETNLRVFQISGFVKWFDVARGYGFIIPDTGLPDVLLHLSCLKRDGYEAPLEGTRVLCESPSAPSLPYVTAGMADDDLIKRLHAALDRALADPALAAVRDDLLIAGVEVLPLEAYDVLLKMEVAAAAAGYATLA